MCFKFLSFHIKVSIYCLVNRDGFLKGLVYKSNLLLIICTLQDLRKVLVIESFPVFLKPKRG